jgi:hypothetical protein
VPQVLSPLLVKDAPQSNVVVTLLPSGDSSGATDAAAINTAVSALPSTGGIVTLSPGTWYIECGIVSISQSGIYINAEGCFINAVGAGDMIRMYDTNYGSRNFYGGGLLGFPMIDGSSTTGNSCALHIGDILQLRIYAQVRHFNAGTTSKGIWIDNNYYWSEQGKARIFAQACSAGVVFDNSANTSTFATGSFDRFDLTAFVDQQQQGDGVVLQNGAIIVNGKLNIYGNFGYTTSPVYAVLRITGNNTGGYSLIDSSIINTGVECTIGAGSVAPNTITFGSSSNSIQNCSGIMDFGSGDAFANSNNSYNMGSFSGPISGDTALITNLNGPAVTAYIGSGFPSGWGGDVFFTMPNANSLVFVSINFYVSSGTVMTFGETIYTGLPSWVIPKNNTIIPVDISGTYGSFTIGTSGDITYSGPTQTVSSSYVFPYGQTVYSNS